MLRRPDEFPIVGQMDGKRQYIIGGMAGWGTAVSFNAGRCIVNRILGITSEPEDYPGVFQPHPSAGPATPHLAQAREVPSTM
jgi:hypothetical protein